MNSKCIFGMILSLHGIGGLVYTIMLYSGFENSEEAGKELLIYGAPGLAFFVIGIGSLVKMYLKGQSQLTGREAWTFQRNTKTGQRENKMKVGLVIIASFLFSSVSSAQTISPKTDTSKIYRIGMDEIKPGPDSILMQKQVTPACPKPLDYCTLEKGKVFCVRNSVLEPVDKSVVLGNGTIVSGNGRIKTKEGKAWQLKNGERIDMNGNRIPVQKPVLKEESPKESRK